MAIVLPTRPAPLRHQGPPPRRHETALLATVTAAVLLPCIVLCAYLHGSRTNTIEANGRWLATKAVLERGVMGTQHFLETPTSLARGRLQLGSWHGFQEVLYREPVQATQVTFDYRLAENAYALLIFRKTPTGFRALRLSRTPDFPSAYVTASPGGEFISREVLSQEIPETGTVTVQFGDGSVEAFLNDTRRLGSYPTPLGSPSFIGFRGGLRSAWIDNIEIHRSGENRPFVERFSNHAGFTRGLMAAVPATPLLVLLAGTLLARRGVESRKRYFAIISAGGVLLVALGSFTVAHELVLVHAHGDGSPEEEERFRVQEASLIRREVRQRHPPSPREGTTRLLFIGTSQTWGAGAAREEDTFVRCLERRLNAGSEQRYECINGGIMALTAPRLLAIYKEDWLSLKPDLVVVHLSNNDVDAAAFEAALSGFAELATAYEIPTIFSLEANSIEHSGNELPLHPVMREVAARYGLPIVDAHGALAARADDGLLWWDFVHPSTYGHRLIAEALWPAVAQLSGRSSELRDGSERKASPPNSRRFNDK